MATTTDGGASYQSFHSAQDENEPQQLEIDSSLLHENGSDKDDDVSSAEILYIDDAIERLGYGRFQLKMLVAAGLCFAADSMEILLLSFLSLVIKEEWDLDDKQSASITSSVFAGATLGTTMLGYLGDRIGRRPVFCLAATIISVFGMATALAQNYHQLLLIRFLVGFGVGGGTVPFDALAEFLPTLDRGKNLLYIEYFWAAGTLLVPVIAYVCLGVWRSWRWFVFFCALPCLSSAIMGTWVVPESPRWLCAQDRSVEALKILREAAAENGHDPNWLFPPGTQLQDDIPEEHSTVCDLLAPKWRRLTLQMWGAWFGFAFGYYGAVLAITQVFEDNSQERNDAYDFDYAAILTSGAGEVFGTTLVILTIDRIGRIPSQLVSYAMGGTCVFLLCILVAFRSAPRWMLVLFAFLARTFEMSATCVTWVSTAEILTTEIRTSGHSAANAIARIGGFTSPFLVVESTPLVVVGVVMLLTHAFTVYCVSQLPETKGLAIGATTHHHPPNSMPLESEEQAMTNEEGETIQQEQRIV